MKLKVKWKELGKQLWEMCRALARVGRAATAKPPARAHAVKRALLRPLGPLRPFGFALRAQATRRLRRGRISRLGFASGYPR